MPPPPILAPTWQRSSAPWDARNDAAVSGEAKPATPLPVQFVSSGFRARREAQSYSKCYTSAVADEPNGHFGKAVAPTWDQRGFRTPLLPEQGREPGMSMEANHRPARQRPGRRSRVLRALVEELEPFDFIWPDCRRCRPRSDVGPCSAGRQLRPSLNRCIRRSARSSWCSTRHRRRSQWARAATRGRLRWARVQPRSDSWCYVGTPRLSRISRLGVSGLIYCGPLISSGRPESQLLGSFRSQGISRLRRGSAPDHAGSDSSP